ncbi:hypothetical protein RDI58_027376 [Solanum bulbocastanum]|uniref:Uncharacterized protein n=1 Tax=Solanum bulbocastanum TaxID=147425 RepID=A0AAN8SVD9_SOLBU
MSFFLLSFSLGEINWIRFQNSGENFQLQVLTTIRYFPPLDIEFHSFLFFLNLRKRHKACSFIFFSEKLLPPGGEKDVDGDKIVGLCRSVNFILLPFHRIGSCDCSNHGESIFFPLMLDQQIIGVSREALWEYPQRLLLEIQVYSQPVFPFVEKMGNSEVPENRFLKVLRHQTSSIPSSSVNPLLFMFSDSTCYIYNINSIGTPLFQSVILKRVMRISLLLHVSIHVLLVIGKVDSFNLEFELEVDLCLLGILKHSAAQERVSNHQVWFE